MSETLWIQIFRNLAPPGPRVLNKEISLLHKNLGPDQKILVPEGHFGPKLEQFGTKDPKSGNSAPAASAVQLELSASRE